MTEVVDMISEWYKEQRFQQGFAEGIAKGEARERERWVRWNRRREAALQRREPFSDPAPSLRAHRRDDDEQGA